MGVFDRIAMAFSGSSNKGVDVVDVQKAIYFTMKEVDDAKVNVRPVGAVWGTVNSDYYKIPNMPYSYKFFRDLYLHSDLLRVVVRSLVQETFRNGLYVEPKFKWKCVYCGMEYDEKPDVCEVCGYHKFVEPSNWQKLYLKRWLEQPVNENGEYLQEVLEAIDYDLNIFDNAYLIVRKRYSFNENGEIVGAEPIEILRGEPSKIFLVMSSDGRPGFTDDGRKMVLTCPLHRDKVVQVDVDEYKRNPDKFRCEHDNLKLVKAVAVFRKGGKDYTLIDGEILHIKKFTHGLGYGISPILPVILKLMILMRMDYYVFTAYQLQRPPQGVLVIKGREEEVYRQWQFLMEVARNNPHMIWPLVLPVDEKTAKAKLIEWLDLSYKAQDIDFIQYREEIWRKVGAIWGVMPLFQADLSTGSGLANQGLQLTVTNRAVEKEQSIFNNKVLRWLVKQLGVTDWIIQLRPHEEKDLKAQIEREMMRTDLAYKVKGLGYQPVMKEGPDGIDWKFVPMSAEEMLRNALKEYAKEKGLRDEQISEILSMIENFNNEEKINEVVENSNDETDEIVGVVGEGGKVEPAKDNGRMEAPHGAPEGWVTRAENQGFEGMPEMRRKERKDKGEKRDSGSKEGKDTRADVYQQLKEEGVL